MEDLKLASNDHDILLTLVANVKNLKESQENFHVEIKESFRDLKDNYANRLEYIEKCQKDADKIFIAKEEQDKKDAQFNLRITWLERIAYTGLGVLTALEFYFRYFNS